MATIDARSANMDWDAVVAAPDSIGHGFQAPSDARDRVLELYKQALRVKATAKKSLVRDAARDFRSLIKKDNRYTGGVRKRKFEVKRCKGMPRPETLGQYQRHSIHNMTCVLNLFVVASPFTVVLDDLNQRAEPLVAELQRRALSRNLNVVYVTFEAMMGGHSAIQYVSAWGHQTGDQILGEIAAAMDGFQDSVVIVDSLYDLLNVKHVDMSALFNLVANKYASMLIGVYHTDLVAAQYPKDAYNPQPLDAIKYMATAIITCKSLAHVLAIKAAKERSLAEPSHGLLRGAEGIVECLDANDHRGIVLEGEFRRRSGRPEFETYFLRSAHQSDYHEPTKGLACGVLKKEFVILLDQLPAYGDQAMMQLVHAAAQDIESTFNLGLTKKQKEAREGVVLPYFDAQKGEGGEGGRILYDMGKEDDFDEEEDEI